MKRDADDVKKLITQLTRLDVFRLNTALREEEDGDMDSISGDTPLLSLASKGRTVEMGSILKHELSPVPLSLAKHGGDMNSTQSQCSSMSWRMAFLYPRQFQKPT